MQMGRRQERLRIIPLALAEAVRPLEKIGDVKIIDMGGGLPGRGGNGADGAAGSAGACADESSTAWPARCTPRACA